MRVGLLLGFLLVLGCSKSTPAKQGADSSGDRVVPAMSGLIFDDQSGLCFVVGESVPFTGKATWNYSNGQMMQETDFLNGREHGPERWWFEDGKRAGQCAYTEGLLDGPCVHWHPDGDTKALQVVYRAGKRDGMELEWYANGKEKSAAQFKNGEQEGEAKGWYEDGQLAWSSNWKQGREHGLSVEYYRNGKKKSERDYDSGQMTGTEKHWFESGTKGWESVWIKGRREGVRVEWFENGQKMSETLYRQGMRDGNSTGWYQNGNKSFEEIYQADELVRSAYWDKNGTLQPADVVPAGLSRRWASGEIERYYIGKTVEIILMAFGEPDTGKDGAWIYEQIFVGGLPQQMQLEFKEGRVVSIRVAQKIQ